MMLYTVAFFGVIANIGTVYFLRTSEGMQRLWPTIGAVVTIVFAQWVISRLMASGMQVGPAITFFVVAVMLGSVAVGFAFDERPAGLQYFGYGLAVIGVGLVNLAPVRQ